MWDHFFSHSLLVYLIFGEQVKSFLKVYQILPIQRFHGFDTKYFHTLTKKLLF